MFSFALPEAAFSPLIILLLAFAVDTVIGDPPALWARVPHPVVAIGNLIGWADGTFNKDGDAPERRRQAGMVFAAALICGGALAGWALAQFSRALSIGVVLEIALVAVFLAGRSLHDHVSAVAQGLTERCLAGGRAEVARIVGRDPEQLDEAGVVRAAIESLAENFSDGVVAPAFWYALFGLPGLVAYKALNTADSMVGHKSERHADFGWASARLDDFANLIPARLAGFLICAAACILPDTSGPSAITVMMRDAAQHRSPNAGWPEAAMAGALGIALAGPRIYAAGAVDDPYMGAEGRSEIDGAELGRALRLYFWANAIFAAGIAFLAWLI